MDTPRRITLADVAQATGVHATTVSLALRNHPRIPEETKARIRAVAEKMGYAPDPMMRALVAYRSNNATRRNIPTLAYLTNWKTRWGWKKITAHPDFYEGAETKARELGFKLDHFWLGEPGLTHVRLNSILRTRGITGLILASHGCALGDTLQLDWRNYSAIKIDYFPHQPLLHNVTNNQCDIARLAMQRVMAIGYKRIGFVMHRGWDHSADHYWTAGFLCEQQNVEERYRIPAYIFPGPHPVEGWFSEYGMPATVDVADFKQWYERYRPEVILSNASFVLPALKTLGLRVPRDVSFVELFLGDVSGATAGVRQNHTTVGALAVELLAGQLQHNKYGVPEIPTTTFVEGTWFDGATCPPRAKR
jgi:LacI family transcriptional regulator